MDKTFHSDTWQICLTPEPSDMPFRAIYDGGTWKPCLIIDGPNTEGYAFNGRVVCDAAGALELLVFLKSHEETLTKLAGPCSAISPGTS